MLTVSSGALRQSRFGEEFHHRRRVHLRRRRHSFMRLTGQYSDACVRQHGHERISDVEVARTLRSDLQKYRDLQLTIALSVELIFIYRAKVFQRSSCVGDDWRPEF